VTDPLESTYVAMCGFVGNRTPYKAWIPAMSSLSIERLFVFGGVLEPYIVASPSVECANPSACPYSCVATPWMSAHPGNDGVGPGPSYHVAASA